MCNCVKQINDELKKMDANTVIRVPITLSGIRRVCIEAEKEDSTKRKKSMKVFASYCPFCGKKYEDKINE